MENKGKEKGETSKGKGKIKYRPLNFQRVATYRCRTCHTDLYTNLNETKCIMEGHEVMKMKDFKRMTESMLNGEGGFHRKFPGGHNEDDLVVCTDGAWSKEKGTCYGVIFRSGSLDYITGFSEVAESTVLDNNIAEARAIKLGLKTAVKMVEKEKKNCKKIALYSDSLLAVNAYNTGETRSPNFPGYIPLSEINEMRFAAGEASWKRAGVLDENHNPTPQSTTITVSHIYRELNSAADDIAGRYQNDEYHIDESIKDIVKEDKYLFRFIKPRKDT